jgi:hypothetical protein
MEDTASRRKGAAGPSRRWALAVVAVIGLGLALAPVAFGMLSKAPKGATMMAEFKPYMTTTRLDGYQQDLAQINAGIRQADSTAAAYLNDVTGSRETFDQRFPDFASFDRQWPSIDATMTNLMDNVQGNLGNYKAMTALPSFRLFPWLFIIPGALLALGAAALLLWPSLWRRGRWVLAVIGIALLVAPFGMDLFGRAPDGGRMMSAFKTIETNANVEKIQGYFGSMADGQGAIRLEIVPALEASGLNALEVAGHFPAVARLDANWVHILNDMTPMIGAMSDNVANYQAISSLPPFALFPWFFLLPGILVVGLVLQAGRGRRRLSPSSDVVPVGTEPMSVPAFAVREGVS